MLPTQWREEWDALRGEWIRIEGPTAGTPGDPLNPLTRMVTRQIVPIKDKRTGKTVFRYLTRANWRQIDWAKLLPQTGGNRVHWSSCHSTAQIGGTFSATAERKGLKRMQFTFTRDPTELEFQAGLLPIMLGGVALAIVGTLTAGVGPAILFVGGAVSAEVLAGTAIVGTSMMVFGMADSKMVMMTRPCSESQGRTAVRH